MLRTVGIFLFVVCYSILNAQEINIDLGPDEIAANQVFTIGLTIKNEALKNYSDFPDIEGFRKRGTSSSSSTQIINGQISSAQSITMTYSPVQQGVFILKPFKMNINGTTVESKGKTIRVGPPVSANRPQGGVFDHDPFEQFFGRKREEPEFIDVKEDAFLALTTDKNEVFVGEGVTADLSFYVADNNRAILQFYELGKQLAEILKTLKPENCWEENFNIENINGEPVTLNGKNYTQYKIYEATFFPFNNQPVIFPASSLNMIKYKVAKNPSFFGSNRKEDFKAFKSREKKVLVKELPPHPLRDRVTVGNYKLNEQLEPQTVETGESFKYTFSIYGQGNISAIEAPVAGNDGNIDFYSPNITQRITRTNGRVAGTKSFSYYGIPNEPGIFPLGQYFEWVFFNPDKAVYDTLRSQYTLGVKGESKKNESIQANDLGDYYNKIQLVKNDLSRAGSYELVKLLTNIMVLVMLGVSAFIIFKK
ncbi:MAG: BatD family protein [Cyclobacteriaceae bacterium]|nr:BatD family protein [Cyclobacteriaceae bacterium]